jgi:ABC-type Fe3+-siderophore transport system permease subunit
MPPAPAPPAAFDAGRRFTPARAARILTLLAAILLAVAVAATLTGSSGVGLRDLPSILSGTASAESRTILADVRLPRVLLAAAVGAALAAAGGALQSVLRNPLADPYILGLSGGAGFGAILWTSLVTGSGLLAAAMRPVFSFAGAVAAVLGLLVLSRARGRRNPATMLLMGAVINATFIALILFVITVADVSRYQGVMYWLVGSLAPPTGPALALIYACVIAGIAALTLLGGPLNLMSAGEETAEHLGAPAARVRLLAILASCLVTAAAVSVSGLIGFVGLMVPHLARLWFGPDNRLLVPSSALLGATILIAADTVARAALAPTQIPVGVITALAGGPCFLWLFATRGEGGEA